jgi:hypothetical protein
MINNEKDKALFVAFYYWQVGHPKATLWQTFGDVYAMAEKFVQTYSPEDTWEDTSFEDYMVEFIQKHSGQAYSPYALWRNRQKYRPQTMGGFGPG